MNLIIKKMGTVCSLFDDECDHNKCDLKHPIIDTYDPLIYLYKNDEHLIRIPRRQKISDKQQKDIQCCYNKIIEQVQKLVARSESDITFTFIKKYGKYDTCPSCCPSVVITDEEFIKRCDEETLKIQSLLKNFNATIIYRSKFAEEKHKVSFSIKEI